MSRFLPIFVLILIAIGGGAGWWMYLAPLSVTLSPVTRGGAAEVVYATGVVEPVKWAKIAPLTRKRLISTCSCEGRFVKAGEELARQDSALEQAALDELLARRQMLERDLHRSTELLGRNVAAATAVEQASTALKEIDARVAAAREALDDLILRAPIDGTVLRADFSAGEIVTTTDILFWIGQSRPLQITADVNEEDIARVKVGQTVLVRHEGFAADQLVAHVSEVTPKGDPSTKTFRVRLALPDDTPLLIGMSIEANIVTAESKNALLIPTEALINDHVLVLSGGTLKQHSVEPGIRGIRMVEIKAGLSEGDLIVSPVPPGAKEGDRARINRTPVAP